MQAVSAASSLHCWSYRLMASLGWRAAFWIFGGGWHCLGARVALVVQGVAGGDWRRSTPVRSHSDSVVEVVPVARALADHADVLVLRMGFDTFTCRGCTHIW